MIVIYDQTSPKSLDQITALLHGTLSQYTLGSRGYFFLIDADGSRWSRVNEAQSAEEKADTDTWEGPEDVRLIEVSLYF